MSEKLKVCAHCGKIGMEADQSIDAEDGECIQYGCCHCGIWFNTPEEWNTRTADAEIAGLKAELERIKKVNFEYWDIIQDFIKEKERLRYEGNEFKSALAKVKGSADEELAEKKKHIDTIKKNVAEINRLQPLVNKLRKEREALKKKEGM